MLLAETFDRRQNERKAASGDDTVLHVVGGGDFSHCRERGFAAFPKHRTFRWIFGSTQSAGTSPTASCSARSAEAWTSASCPSSSISNTAAASRGYSSYPKKSFTALMVTLSIISIPAGSKPAAVTARTASPAASIVSKSASSTLTHSGARNRRSVIAVAIPSVPSLPMKAPRKSSS